MQLINRDTVEISRQREMLAGGLIYVPLADVQAALDAAVVFSEKDMQTIIEALAKQVRKPLDQEVTEKDMEGKGRMVMVVKRCPTCHTEQQRRRAYCHACGQALEREAIEP